MAHHHHEINHKNLGVTVILNVLITLGELIGGLISGSMALITDAAHNFSDVLALVISYLANRLAKRQATTRHTYGFGRSEIIAAFANSVTLIVIALFIIYEATERIISPVEINSDWVIYLAGGSILLNGLSVLLISQDAKKNMNMRSAYLHLFSDMMTSVGVLIGGLVMKFFHWYYVDALFSIAIALYLLYLSWAIFRDSLRILMQFAPKNIDVEDICQEIAALDGIVNIHHVHCWQLDDHKRLFDAHIDLASDICLSEFEKKLATIKEILAGHGITQVNIQPEFGVEDSKELIHHHK